MSMNAGNFALDRWASNAFAEHAITILSTGEMGLRGAPTAGLDAVQVNGNLSAGTLDTNEVTIYGGLFSIQRSGSTALLTFNEPTQSSGNWGYDFQYNGSSKFSVTQYGTVTGGLSTTSLNNNSGGVTNPGTITQTTSGVTTTLTLSNIEAYGTYPSMNIGFPSGFAFIGQGTILNANDITFHSYPSTGGYGGYLTDMNGGGVGTMIGTNNGSGPTLFLVNGAEKARVSTGGNLLLGTTTDPSGAGSVIATGNVAADTAGKGLQVKEGANAKEGTATLAAGTATVSNANVTASSRIFLTTQAPGGTVGTPYISARTAGTSFTITSTSSTDTSTVAYEIFEPAP
jgi:hypothetical protein